MLQIKAYMSTDTTGMSSLFLRCVFSWKTDTSVEMGWTNKSDPGKSRGVPFPNWRTKLPRAEQKWGEVILSLWDTVVCVLRARARGGRLCLCHTRTRHQKCACHLFKPREPATLDAEVLDNKPWMIKRSYNYEAAIKKTIRTINLSAGPQLAPTSVCRGSQLLIGHDQFCRGASNPLHTLCGCS